MNTVGFGFEEDGSRLKVVNIHDKYPQIFDWLNLQDMNVLIILILMLVVAGFNMVSGLLILILDRTNMIGILKALGSPNVSIRKIFMYQSGFLILRGLFWGNIIGIGICLLQKYIRHHGTGPVILLSQHGSGQPERIAHHCPEPGNRDGHYRDADHTLHDHFQDQSGQGHPV